jgi:hypothetical protein
VSQIEDLSLSFWKQLEQRIPTNSAQLLTKLAEKCYLIFHIVENILK